MPLPSITDSAGLTVDATVSVSTALLPGAGNRYFLPLDTPLVWDGTQHLCGNFDIFFFGKFIVYFSVRCCLACAA